MTALPALYIGHGAPMLLDDPLWSSEIAAITEKFEKPKAILIVSAHWESAPISISSPETLIEGFWMGLSKRSLLVA